MAVITGAGSGIGREVAVEFGVEVTRVIVSDVNAEGGKETVDHAEDAGGDAMFIETDVTDLDAVQRKIDVAVSTDASISRSTTPASEASRSQLASTAKKTGFGSST